MKYFEKSAIAEGKLVMLTRKDRYEGWCELIEPVDEGMTFYEGNKLLLKQRWLVEWVAVDRIQDFLQDGDRITQHNLAGKRTHRTIIYVSPRRPDRHKFPLNLIKKESEFSMSDDFGEVF